MINKLLSKYVYTLTLNKFVNEDPVEPSRPILEEIAAELQKENWKEEVAKIDNHVRAMEAFFDIFIREIGDDDTPSFLCYYFSTIVTNDVSLPENIRNEGYKYRAMIVFKNRSNWKWEFLFSQARTSPLNNYRGHLNETSFFDMTLLSDIYKAWNTDPLNPIMDSLKRQAPKIALKQYSSYTKEKIMVEGELAHKAILNEIKMWITPEE